jgi:hypothetical protein
LHETTEPPNHLTEPVEPPEPVEPVEPVEPPNRRDRV